MLNPQMLTTPHTNFKSQDVEFFGIEQNMTVKFIQGNKIQSWKDLSKENLELIYPYYVSDTPFHEFIEDQETQYNIQLPEDRKMELYVYFMWGALDANPDIKDGVLQLSENYRHIENCPSRKFKHKKFMLGEVELTDRDLTIIDMSAKEYKNLVIADELGIKEKSLEAYCKRFYERTGVHTKIGLVNNAHQNQLIRA